LKAKDSNNRCSFGSPTFSQSKAPFVLEDSNVHSSSPKASIPCDVCKLPLNGLSLEEMLERSDETAAIEEYDHSNCGRRREFGISAEDIDFFHSNKHRVQQQRQELRTKLKSQFLDMQRRLRCASPSCLPCSRGMVYDCGRVPFGDRMVESVPRQEADERKCEADLLEAEKKKMTGMRA